MLVFNNNNSQSEVTNLSSSLHIGDIENNSDQIVFETSYIVCGNLHSDSEVICNYDLYVVGDIKAKKLRVKKDLMVLGNIDVDEIIVQGDIFCLSAFKVNQLTVGGNIQANSFQLNGSGIVKKNLTVRNSIIIQKDLTVDKDLYCFEGIIGEGKCVANNIYVKEFYDLSSKDNVILLDDLGEMTRSSVTYEGLLSDDIFLSDERLKEFSASIETTSNKLIVLFEEYVSRIEEELDFEQIEERFLEIQKIMPQLNSYLDDYKQILRLANFSKIVTIDDFIILLRVKSTTPKFLYQISIVEDVLNNFYVEQKKNIEKFEIKNKDRTILIKNLYYLEKTKYLISKNEYKYLYQLLLNELIQLGGI